ncbi:hypothetical protein JRO89_XS09G0107000 [Xanthoceras sorbifolium]|uniref:PX domain-containing protein n=1 Tax=Xanthoceras sorbifolium TaxID=99658 RepID=A0ABQ8HKY2_9ROSI|nr:hypothetical protein JRO89_XS09G0107000 [Xanthoceras sorbifolium]
MNLYAYDLSLFDFSNFSDPIISHPNRISSSLISTYDDDDYDDDKSSKSKSAESNRRSPPRHRHDGTSPLPLGMDWSSPPRKWVQCIIGEQRAKEGEDDDLLVYSITSSEPISEAAPVKPPIIQIYSRRTPPDSCPAPTPLMDGTPFGHMILIQDGVIVSQFLLGFSSQTQEVQILLRVQVGIQSPEGITTMRGILRRFSDFLKLLSELKKAFPNKEFPHAPPKRILKTKSSTLLEELFCAASWMHTQYFEDILLDQELAYVALIVSVFHAVYGLKFHLAAVPEKRVCGNNSGNILRMLSLLQRRRSLEEWMEKLLSDIDISRSVSVATFLELEAAARSSFHDQETSDAHSSLLFQTNSVGSVVAGSLSVASDHGDDSPDETSELGTPRCQTHNSGDFGTECSTSQQNINDPIEKSVKYGMFNRKFILENLGKLSRHKMLVDKATSVVGRDKLTEDTFKTNSFNGDGTEVLHETEYQRLQGHVRRLSTESVGSDLSSIRASEISNFGVSNLFGDSSLDHPEGVEASRTMDALDGSNSLFTRTSLVAVPSDQRLKLNRVLNTMQQRLATAKTDMEDLIARLNQEVAVRQFLTTKVKDLEVELETTRENCKENMQQAVLTEKERFTQMQWDMEELRKQCLEMELKLKYEQAERAHAESSKISLVQENEMLLQDLDVARDQLDNLHKHHEELEVKSKADVKLLVKEVKSLRSSQSELKQELGRLMKEKLEVEVICCLTKLDFLDTSTPTPLPVLIDPTDFSVFNPSQTISKSVVDLEPNKEIANLESEFVLESYKETGPNLETLESNLLSHQFDTNSGGEISHDNNPNLEHYPNTELQVYTRRKPPLSNRDFLHQVPAQSKPSGPISEPQMTQHV